MGRAFGSLLLLLAIAIAARYIWDLLTPLIPTIATLAVLMVVIALLFQLWRRR
jgi:hypothetical protein